MLLEALQSERPELKAHAPQFTNLQTPGAMIALLEEKLSAVGADIDTRSHIHIGSVLVDGMTVAGEG